MSSDYPSVLLEQAVDQMASLPGVGRKTALRLVLQLLRRPENEVAAFSDSFTRLKREVHYCRECYNLCDAELCPVCSSMHRDHSIICVVENVQDVMSIERTGQYNGLYHVLGGIISPMDGVGPSDLNIEALVKRVLPTTAGGQKTPVSEVILALPTTMEGDTTNFYIYRRLMNALRDAAMAGDEPTLRVSQIARGVAVGNDLEYTDEITLGRSIINRTEFKL